MVKLHYYGLSKSINTLCYSMRQQKSLKSLQNQLITALCKIGWISLSSNQIGKFNRFFIMLKREHIKHDKWSQYKKIQSHQIRSITNPQIKDYSIQVSEGWEECPSYPGLRFLVERPVSIKTQYQNKSTIKEEQINGFESRVFQHETDHILGIDILKKSKKIQILNENLKNQNQSQIDTLLSQYLTEKQDDQNNINFKKLKQMVTYSIIDKQKN